MRSARPESRKVFCRRRTFSRFMAENRSGGSMQLPERAMSYGTPCITEVLFSVCRYRTKKRDRNFCQTLVLVFFSERENYGSF
jgi:hypothetical protein